jgi:UDP-N-acetylglucosamine--N-acetylmuramyl-(pentapeptide) pyrophosphoryl-undecaprenol N-acetylglucosamine transferase
MGGSQGASGVNSAIIGALPRLHTTLPDWQWLHLAGAGEEAKVREAYRANGLRAAVHAFLDEMDLALGVSSVAVTRAGGSTLAELAALRLPAVLIPFPAATDNHQWHNARAFETIGAGRLVSQSAADPATLVNSIAELACNASTREAMQSALGRWHKADSAARITEAMLELAPQPNRVPSSSGSPFGSTPSHHPSVIA